MWISWTIRNPQRFSHAVNKASLEASSGNPQQAFTELETLIAAALQTGDEKLKERGLYGCLAEAYAAQAGIRRQEGNDNNAEELFLRARQYGGLSGEATSFLAERLVAQARTDEAAWGIFLDYCKTRDFAVFATIARASQAFNYGTRDDKVLEYLRNLCEVTPETSPARFEYLKSKNTAISKTGCRFPWNIFSMAYIGIDKNSRNKHPLEQCMFEIMWDPELQLDGFREANNPASGHRDKIEVKWKDLPPPEVRAQQAGPQPKFYVARCLAGLNRCQEALALLQTLENEMNSWWIYHFALGTVYFRLGQADDAKRRFEEAERKAGHSIGAAQLHLGHLALQTGNIAAAAEYYYRAHEHMPDDWRALYSLGRTRLISGRLNEAIPALVKATDLSKSLIPMMALALAYEIQGDLEKAVSQYNRCLSFFPDMAVLNFRKGICLAVQGKLSQAMDCFATAVTQDQKIDDKIKKLAPGKMAGTDVEKPVRKLMELPESVADAARFYWGALSIEQKNLPQAIQIWRTIQSSYWRALVRPQLAAAQVVLAEAEFDKEHYSAAADSWAESLTYLDSKEEKAEIEGNILEARFRQASAGSVKTGQPPRLQRLREVITKDDSTRGRYFSYLLSLAEGTPDRCDFLSLAGVDGLNAARCKYHYAVARMKQGFFEEQLLTEIAHENGEYSAHASQALLAGYLRRRCIPEALSALAEVVGEGEEKPERIEEEASIVIVTKWIKEARKR
jgi:tetratricopeptide (TPR) repeat protein